MRPTPVVASLHKAKGSGIRAAGFAPLRSGRRYAEGAGNGDPARVSAASYALHTSRLRPKEAAVQRHRAQLPGGTALGCFGPCSLWREEVLCLLGGEDQARHVGQLAVCIAGHTLHAAVGRLFVELGLLHEDALSSLDELALF